MALAFYKFSALCSQVILMLTTDLDGEDEKDKGALDNLLSQLIAELCMDKKVSCRVCTHSQVAPSRQGFFLWRN